jgi:hypothetical protein
MIFVSLTGNVNTGPFEFIVFIDFLINSLLSQKLFNLYFYMSHFRFPLTGLGIGIFLSDA